MLNNTNLNEISKLIQKSKKIVITSHANPDGDAIGSSVGLCEFLIGKGYDAEILLFNAPPRNLEFLVSKKTFFYEDDNSISKKLLESDLIIILDFNNPSRVKGLSESLLESNAKKIVIDHHIDPKEFADFYQVNTDVGSTAELIWELINEIGGKINKYVAEALYIGIMTDHGNFKYDRTNEKTFQIVSKLCELGVKPNLSYDKIYGSDSLERVKLFGLVSSRIEIIGNGKIGFLEIREADLVTTGTLEDDTEGFASFPLSIQGVEVAVLMIESKKSDEIRCSFRSKGSFYIREVALKFGGGGHNYASGARIKNKDFLEAKSLILKETEKYVESRL